MDRWDRKTDFGCNSCMFFVPKRYHEGRCRRYAPTMKGYPVVFTDDWCGEHKRGSNPVRDATPPQTGGVFHGLSVLATKDET